MERDAEFTVSLDALAFVHAQLVTSAHARLWCHPYRAVACPDCPSSPPVATVTARPALAWRRLQWEGNIPPSPARKQGRKHLTHSSAYQHMPNHTRTHQLCESDAKQKHNKVELSTSAWEAAITVNSHYSATLSAVNGRVDHDRSTRGWSQPKDWQGGLKREAVKEILVVIHPHRPEMHNTGSLERACVRGTHSIAVRKCCWPFCPLLCSLLSVARLSVWVGHLARLCPRNPTPEKTWDQIRKHAGGRYKILANELGIVSDHSQTRILACWITRVRRAIRTEVFECEAHLDGK